MKFSIMIYVLRDGFINKYVVDIIIVFRIFNIFVKKLKLIIIFLRYEKVSQNIKKKNGCLNIYIEYFSNYFSKDSLINNFLIKKKKRFNS